MKCQKFHLNRIKFLILTFFIIIPIYKVNAIVTPTKNFYVNDYANILTKETEEYIINKSSELYKLNGSQIVVVTVNNLDGKTIEEYAVELFRNFGIGSQKENNGLLLLFSLEERQFRVEVGYGLEGILPDGKTGRFQDKYIIPYLKNNEWDKGIIKGYDAFYSEIAKLDTSSPKASEQRDSNIFLDYIYITIFGIFIGYFIGALISKTKGTKNIFIIIYLILWGIVGLYILTNSIIYLFALIVNLNSFLISIFIKKKQKKRKKTKRIPLSTYNSCDRRWFLSELLANILEIIVDILFGGNNSGGGSSGGGGSSRRF